MPGVTNHLGEKSFTIGQLCAEFGATARSLRFYEDKGLLSPERDGVNRVYGARDWARLKLILQGKRVGLSLAEIGEILDLYDRSDGNAKQMAVSLRKFRERIVALTAQRDDIDSALEALQDGCEWLEATLGKADPESLHRARDYDVAFRERLDGDSDVGAP